MKVFNWVPRGFFNVHSCTTFLQDSGEKKEARSKMNNQSHVLLEHDGHVMVDMIDQWKDYGILAIGTLAIDPLAIDHYGMIEKVDDDDDDHHVMDDNDHLIDDGDDDDDDEARPLMNVEFFSHELEKVIGANHEITEEEAVIMAVINEGEQTKRRVTLADLFLEDCDYHPVKVLKEILDDDDIDHHNVKNYDVINEKQNPKIIMKPTSLAKNGLSKAKKLLKEDLHPLKKFNQLMKKMKKKKIHPDLERKMQKDMKMQPSHGLSNPTNEQQAVNNELSSLLLIQEAMV